MHVDDTVPEPPLIEQLKVRPNVLGHARLATIPATTIPPTVHSGPGRSNRSSLTPTATTRGLEVPVDLAASADAGDVVATFDGLRRR